MGFLSDRREKKERAHAAEEQFSQAAQRIATGDPAEVSAGVGLLRSDPTLVEVPTPVRQRIASETIRAYAAVALADDRLTRREEEAFLEAAEALGIDDTTLGTTYQDLFARLAVAQVNDGRLGQIEEPVGIIPKRGEIVHLQTEAALLKEVAVRQWQGGYGGFSFRVAKGVSFRTGQVRGKSVVVGSELKTEDTGVLSVTSSRVAFLGDRKTVEIPYTKLVGLDVFSDGVTLQSSSRQNAVLLHVREGYGEVIAATVNSAMQSLL
jgi:hypothetical protein